ncbi:MAG: universal stress protein [Deltaproteobacteria bacterium]|nr:universal stress protein [Deltaproteobacteria bacterium]MBW2232259.1 universal stress protein [Deltaproteobacteria bacterium]
MSEESTARVILLALDLSPESQAAAVLAVEVAAAFGAKIEGLFVEDREMLDLADHPLAREVDIFGARTQPVERARLERSLRAQAVRARTLLARVAGRRGIAWTFRVVRGTVVDEIRTASRMGETVTLGRTGWSRGPRRALGRTTQRLLADGERRVLVPGRRPSAAGAVVACYEGSPAGRRVLEAAAQLARGAGAKLRVQVIAGEETELAALREEAEVQLADSDIEAAFHPLVVDRPSELLASLRADPCGFLVVPARAFGDGAELISLVTELDCPLLLVR